MAECRTDCLERPLSRTYRRLGALVASYPYCFLLPPLLISAVMGVGFYRLPQVRANDIEGQFTPLGGPAKTERAVIERLFPTDDSARFSAQRLYTQGTYAALIAVSRTEDILSPAALQEVLELDSAVRRVSVWGLNFSELCARTEASHCAPSNPLLELLGNSASRIDSLNLTYPVYRDGRRSIFLDPYLGGVRLSPPDKVQEAKALRLIYYLREDAPADRNQSLQWLQNFISSFPDLLKNLSLTSVQITIRYTATCKK